MLQRRHVVQSALYHGRTGKFVIIRARNNFRIVSGHDDRPNSFLLGHVSLLAGQMYMMNTLLGAHKPKMKN